VQDRALRPTPDAPVDPEDRAEAERTACELRRGCAVLTSVWRLFRLSRIVHHRQSSVSPLEKGEFGVEQIRALAWFPLGRVVHGLQIH